MRTSCVSRRASARATAAPNGGDAVIAAALVVQFRRGALLGFDEQSLFEHALDGAVQRAGAQLELAVRARGHILNDGVAVPVLLGHGQQNVESRGRKRQERIRLRECLACFIIATLDILSMAIVA